jgi:serine/threonine protein kinase
VAPPSEPIGTFGQLALLEQLGAGSFGVVYRAWDPHLAREVALKVVASGSVAALDTSRIAREGRLLARLRHPNIVTVTDLPSSRNQRACRPRSIWCLNSH